MSQMVVVGQSAQFCAPIAREPVRKSCRSPILNRNKMERVTSTRWFVRVVDVPEVWSRFAGNATDLSTPRALARDSEDSLAPHHTRITFGTGKKARPHEEEASVFRKLFLVASTVLLLPFASAHAG